MILGLLLSHFLDTFFAPAGSLIAGIALTSLTAGLIIARWLRSHGTLETTAIGRWYVYGSVLALGYLAFVPLVGSRTDPADHGRREKGLDGQWRD
jgi:hypothetical protein